MFVSLLSVYVSRLPAPGGSEPGCRRLSVPGGMVEVPGGGREGIRQYSILLRLHHGHTFWGGAPGCELTHSLGILPTGAAVALFGFFLLLFTLRCCQLILFPLGIHQVTEQLLFCLSAQLLGRKAWISLIYSGFYNHPK